MIETVERYVTPDGKEFGWLHSAEAWTLSQVQDLIDKKIQASELKNVSRLDTIKFVQALVGSYEEAVQLKQALDRLV